MPAKGQQQKHVPLDMVFHFRYDDRNVEDENAYRKIGSPRRLPSEYCMAGWQYTRTDELLDNKLEQEKLTDDLIVIEERKKYTKPGTKEWKQLLQDEAYVRAKIHQMKKYDRWVEQEIDNKD